MLAGLLGLIAVGAGVGVHIEKLGDLPETTSRAIRADLASSLDEIAGLEARFDPIDTPCLDPRECAQRIRRDTGTEEVLIVKLLGGALSARCIATRIAAGESAVRGAPAEIDLSLGAASFRPLFDRLVRDVFPEIAADRIRRAAAVRTDMLPPPPRSTGSRLAPWIVLGASVAAGGAGIALGVSSAKDVDSLSAGPHPAAEYRDILGRANTQATVADVLFVAAAAGAVLGIALLFAE